MWEKLKSKRYDIALGGLLAMTAFLTVWKIWDSGDANAYYTAAVTSMLQSWHNFFFVSFDPGGFISVDKPPLGLWLQAASGWLFGVHGWSVILPEAICAVGSVAVLNHIVRRSFGRAAGLAAALALALTPIFIVVGRTNELDSSLVLVMLLAAWAVLKAAENGNLWLWLLSVFLLGLGFNIKMLQAYMALPALALVYAFAAHVNIRKRIAHMAAGLAVLLAVSLVWVLAVDATPADQRPYVGSSNSNSVLELALGYNGIQRIRPGATAGNIGGGVIPPQRLQYGQGQNLPGAMVPPEGQNQEPPMVQPSGNAAWMGTMVGMNEGGDAGVLRLFNEQMAGQASWLIPFSLVGLLALGLSLRGRMKEAEWRHFLLWGGWVLPMMVYFSIAGFFHRYYLCVLAPGLAALCGIGAVNLYRRYRKGRWDAWLLPIGIALTAAVQCVLLSRYEDWVIVLVPILCILAGIAVLALSLGLIVRKMRRANAMLAMTALGLAALLVTPAVWSGTPLVYGTQMTMPIAGPELARNGRGPMPGGWTNERREAPDALIQFLTENNHGEKYLVAVPDANSAAPIILATGKPVMAVGGFLGSDQALSVERLEQMVENGELRYFMTGGRGGQQREIMSWVQQHGTLVSYSLWSGSSSGWLSFGGETLYDLKPER